MPARRGWCRRTGFPASGYTSRWRYRFTRKVEVVSVIVTALSRRSLGSPISRSSASSLRGFHQGATAGSGAGSVSPRIRPHRGRYQGIGNDLLHRTRACAPLLGVGLVADTGSSGQRSDLDDGKARAQLGPRMTFGDWKLLFTEVPKEIRDASGDPDGVFINIARKMRRVQMDGKLSQHVSLGNDVQLDGSGVAVGDCQNGSWPRGTGMTRRCSCPSIPMPRPMSCGRPARACSGDRPSIGNLLATWSTAGNWPVLIHRTVTALTRNDFGGRGRYRTADRWCVNPRRTVYRVSDGAITSRDAQLNGWFVSTLSTFCQAVFARLGTLLAQRGFGRQAFNRVCVADFPFRCQAARSTCLWSYCGGAHGVVVVLL